MQSRETPADLSIEGGILAKPLGTRLTARIERPEPEVEHFVRFDPPPVGGCQFEPTLGALAVRTVIHLDRDVNE